MTDSTQKAETQTAAAKTTNSKGKALFSNLMKKQIQTESEKQAERVKTISEKVQNTKVGDLIVKLKPVINLFSNVVDTVWPPLEKAFGFAEKAYRFIPMELLLALIGLLIAFFGGAFAVTIAALEAIYGTGWETIKTNCLYLYHEFKLLWKKSREDDLKDEDGDGTADVLQISGKELITRKIAFFFANCEEPSKIMDTISGIVNCILAVIAVLKVNFAKVIALGASIGDNLRKPATYILTPILASALPKKYQQWIEPAINVLCKSVAITIAWTIQRVISAFQTGIRGGLMFSRRLLSFLNSAGYITFNEDESYLDEILGWVVAGMGIYFQIIYFWGLPFPLNVLLAPLSAFESILVWSISD